MPAVAISRSFLRSEMPGHESASIAAYPELGLTATPPLAPSNTYGVHLNLQRR